MFQSLIASLCQCFYLIYKQQLIFDVGSSETGGRKWRILAAHGERKNRYFTGNKTVYFIRIDFFALYHEFFFFQFSY